MTLHNKMIYSTILLLFPIACFSECVCLINEDDAILRGCQKFDSDTQKPDILCPDPYNTDKWLIIKNPDNYEIVEAGEKFCKPCEIKQKEDIPFSVPKNSPVIPNLPVEEINPKSKNKDET